LESSSIEIKKDAILVDAKDPVKVAEVLSKIPGVDYTAVVEVVSSRYEDVVEAMARAGIRLIYPRETFSIRADISGSLPYRSRDIEFATASRLIGELGRKGVKHSKKSAKVIYAKIDKEMACTFYYKYDGPGGRPVGSQGRALCLISGDKDSAVATWMMARQGILPSLLFFDIGPYVSHPYVKRAISIATFLREFLPFRRCYLTALKIGSVIDSLKQSCSNEVLPFVLRRMVMRIACAYADRIDVNSVVSGESISKDGFQDLLDLLEASSKYGKYVLFPLVGLSVQEIMDCSKRMGIPEFTYENERWLKVSPQLYDKRAIMEAENGLEIDRLIKEALSKTIMIDLKGGFNDIHTILDHYFSSRV
jgi:thiamine biosynthesis protein ThiI